MKYALGSIGFVLVVLAPFGFAFWLLCWAEIVLERLFRQEGKQYQVIHPDQLTCRTHGRVAGHKVEQSEVNTLEFVHVVDGSKVV